MKKLYFVAGLIAILFVYDNRVDAVDRQDIIFAIESSARRQKCEPEIRPKSISAALIEKLYRIKRITGDTGGRLKMTAEAVDAAGHFIKLANNSINGGVENKRSYPPPPSSAGIFLWIVIVFAAISASSFLFILFLRQKNKHRMQHIFAAPIQKEDRLDSHPQARLVYMGDAKQNDSNPVRLYALDRNRATIGRSTKNAIVIPHSMVSTFHAVIEYKNGYFQLEDKNSLNGTFLKSNRLPPNRPVILNHGDIVKFATLTFHFLRTDRPPSDATIMMAKILE